MPHLTAWVLKVTDVRLAHPHATQAHSPILGVALHISNLPALVVPAFRTVAQVLKQDPQTDVLSLRPAWAHLHAQTPPVAHGDLKGRVQLGVALTPAEKLKVITTPRATFVRKLQNEFLNKNDADLGVIFGALASIPSPDCFVALGAYPALAEDMMANVRMYEEGKWSEKKWGGNGEGRRGRGVPLRSILILAHHTSLRWYRSLTSRFKVSRADHCISDSPKTTSMRATEKWLSVPAKLNPAFAAFIEKTYRVYEKLPAAGSPSGYEDPESPLDHSKYALNDVTQLRVPTLTAINNG
ncbi:hypothetical protein B0H14DRAFT_3529742 [Mycena olivaceomarginata]|nr:hypothetical protein B0H14DRAFT_3529742 [Mycena olivaceomarginata]